MLPDLSKIKQIRKQLGVTQNEFSKESGVSQSLIAKVETGMCDPSYSNAVKLIEALDRLGKSQEKTAKEIMHKEIISIKPSEDVHTVAKIMKKAAVSQLPVIEKNNTIGLITEKDMLKVLEEPTIKKASELMGPPPPIVGEDSELSMVASLMKYYPIVIVANKGKPTGIITKSDIISMMAK